MTFANQIIEVIKEVMKLVRPWIATTIVVLAILYLSLSPEPLPPMKSFSFPGADKIVHAIMFAVLTFVMLFDTALTNSGRRPAWATVIVLAILSTLFGGAIEVIQGAMNYGRTYSSWDWFADGVGSFLAILALPLAVSLAKRFVKR